MRVLLILLCLCVSSKSFHLTYLKSFRNRWLTSLQSFNNMPTADTVHKHRNVRKLGIQVISMSNEGSPENLMNPNLYTERAWNSIASLPQYSEKYSFQYIEAVLLLKSLFGESKGSLTDRIIELCNSKVETLDAKLENYLQKQPKVSSNENKVLGRTMSQCLSKAQYFKNEMGDQFISVEHLLLGTVDCDGFTKSLFLESGISRDKILKAIQIIRGPNKVTSRNPENTYEALKKYSRYELIKI